MRISSLLRVLCGFFVCASALSSVMFVPNNANAQSENGFVADATRLCGESLALRWDASNVEKIEFSITDTSLNWTTGWIEATDFESKYHFEPVGQRFDKVMVRVTFFDGSTAEYSFNIGACEHEITTPWPTLDSKTNAPVPTPVPNEGGGAQAPIPSHDGSFNDPETGNSFAFLSAYRMCADNSLLVTWSGTNLVDLMFTAYNPSPGWGTDWLQADLSTRVFTAEIVRDGAYMVDAGVYFEDGTIEIVTVSIPDCTTASSNSDDIPNAGIGENNVRVTFNMPGGTDISGDPFSVFASQAAAQAITSPYLSGFVGANNTVAIDGLIPGEYRLVVYPTGAEPIEVLITVGNQPVTEATVTVSEDGTTTVAYAAQEAPGDPETPDAGETPAAPVDSTTPTQGTSESSESGESTNAVSGLPSTGVGERSSFLGEILWFATAASVMMVTGGLFIRRHRV